MTGFPQKIINKMSRINISGIILMILLSTKVNSQELNLNEKQFELVDNFGKRLDVIDFKNYKSILLNNEKKAILKNLKAQDFIVEFDVYGQNMTFFGFRAKDSINSECVFFRLMSSNTYESIQYLPITNGSTPWRLYSKYQASCEYNDKDWNHIKIEVVNTHVKIYVNNSITPNLHILHLKNTPERGDLYFNNSFGDSYISNIRFQDWTNNTDKESDIQTYPKPTDKIFISKWIISNAFEEPFLAERLYRKMKDTISQWHPIEAEEDGIVNLSKYFVHPLGTVFVRTYIYSKDETTRVLLFDYSYALGILLNKGIIFYGRELDSKNMGRVEADEESLTIELKKGWNELVFAIKGDYETLQVLNIPNFQSMNWGFIARLNSYEGIEIKEKKE